MLERRDKTIDEIQQIFASTKAKFISKRATGVTGDFAMMSKDWNSTKRKANNENKCFNCGKLRHWGKNCTLPDQRKRNQSHKSSRSNHQQAKQNCANIAALTGEDYFDPEPFKPSMVNMAKKTRQQAPKGVWYLDSCVSQHLTNNRNLFIKELRPKCLDFTTAGGQTLRAKSIRTIAILLDDGSSIRLKRVAYALKCDLHFISLGQLCDNNITYVDNPNAITLMQGGQVIASTRRDRNLFILDLVTPNKVMQVTQPPKAMMTQGQGRSTYLINKNK